MLKHTLFLCIFIFHTGKFFISLTQKSICIRNVTIIILNIVIAQNFHVSASLSKTIKKQSLLTSEIPETEDLKSEISRHQFLHWHTFKSPPPECLEVPPLTSHLLCLLSSKSQQEVSRAGLQRGALTEPNAASPYRVDHLTATFTQVPQRDLHVPSLTAPPKQRQKQTGCSSTKHSHWNEAFHKVRKAAIIT